MDSEELVVVLIASYNHEKYIEETLESILNQTHKNVKIVIVDDYSQDASRDIILTYAGKYPDKVHYLFNEINMHVNRSLNKGLDFIKKTFDPKWIAITSSDDVLELNKIKLQVDFLKKHSHLNAVAAAGKYIDEESTIKEAIGLADIFNKDLYTNEDCIKYKEHAFKIGFGGPLMQSMLFEFNGIYEIKFALDSVSDDYIAFIRYLVKGYNVGFMNQQLWRYRLHSLNGSKSMDYTYIVLDVIHRVIPSQYRKTAFFNHIFMRAIYQLFYHKNRAEGVRCFIFSMTYLNTDSIQYFSKKFFKGLKWIWKNR